MPTRAARSDTWLIDMQCAFPGPTATRYETVRQRLWSHPTCWRYTNKIIIIIIIIIMFLLKVTLTTVDWSDFE